MAKHKLSLAETLKKVLKHKVTVEWQRRPEILLSGNIPAPMHGTNPRSILGSKWWNETRLEAYRSTDQHCAACGVHRYSAPMDRLEGHELYEVDYLVGLMTYVETVPLCKPCHEYVHSGRLEALFSKGQITEEKYHLVINHGNRVLKQADLSPKGQYEGPLAEWKKWRLVVNGKKFKPHFKSQRAWEQAFSEEK